MNVAEWIAGLTGTGTAELRALGGQHLWRHYAATLTDGRRVFAKFSERPVASLMASEARGLQWLASAGGPGVPEVLGCDGDGIVLSWVSSGPATPGAAQRFGRELAAMHAAGAETFGAPWPGYIASLPLDNEAGSRGGWPEWYAARRLIPFLRRAADAGTLAAGDVRLVESVIGRIGELAGPAERPSRIHGDCWSGNVLWSAGRGWLVDPAAHGGHRETDLAMLALFGAPHLERILAAYDEAAPLAGGWQARVPLHQLHPLLVHVCLFGASYRERLRDAARSALAA